MWPSHFTTVIYFKINKCKWERSLVSVHLNSHFTVKFWQRISVNQDLWMRLEKVTEVLNWSTYAKATCRMIALALMVQFTPLLCTPYVLYNINSVSANICALTIALLLHKLSFLIFNRPKKEPQMNYCTKYLHHTKKIEFVGKDEHLYRICTTYVAWNLKHKPPTPHTWFVLHPS